jgi:creatinine amidohydrolase
VTRAAHISWMAAQGLAEAGAVALLPVGSTEAHGPHLPLSVDVLIAEAVAERTAALLEAAGKRAVLFPAVSYGVTEFADGFAGTVHVPAEATQPYLEGVLRGIVRHGFREVGVLNHHLEPAQFAVVHAAARAVAESTGARVVVPDHRKKPHGPRLGEEFVSGGSHAGWYETSLVLAAAPHLVDRAALASLPEVQVNLPAAIKAGGRSFEACGGPRAYFGAPGTATAEDGERLLGILAEISVAAFS